MRIFSIGYEGVTQAALTQTSPAVGLGRVVDVRAVPMSRRRGLSRSNFARGLRTAQAVMPEASVVDLFSAERAPAAGGMP